MKLFLATNEATIKTENKKMLEVSTKSALKNTNFDVYVIFDGDKNLLDLPSDVKIIEHRHRCYETIKNSKKCAGDENALKIGSGAYLRTEIPHIMKENNFDDEFCLYTDYDVIFQKFDTSELESIKPGKIAVGPEFNMSDYVTFNTGVMIMNIKHFQSVDDYIINYIKNNFDRLETWDQTMYQNLYSNNIVPLNPEYNWKPYWGINDKSKIIHFHGPKPFAVQPYEKSKEVQILKQLLNFNPSSYNYYNELFNSFL